MYVQSKHTMCHGISRDVCGYFQTCIIWFKKVLQDNDLGSLLLTRSNFNPGMNKLGKEPYAQESVGWN